MPAPTGAQVFKDALITVDGVDYANQLNKARLVPDQPIQTFRTLVPDGSVTDVDSATWVFELTGLQINIAGGLAEYLRSVTGEEIEVVLQPKTGSGQPTATFTSTALDVEFGGEQGAFLPIDLTLPVKGRPTFGDSA